MLQASGNPYVPVVMAGLPGAIDAQHALRVKGKVLRAAALLAGPDSLPVAGIACFYPVNVPPHAGANTARQRHQVNAI